MLIPAGRRLRLPTGSCPGRHATDLVLTVTQMLRKKGRGRQVRRILRRRPAPCRRADRATIANMAPEYGATCGSSRSTRNRWTTCAPVRPRPRRQSRWSRPMPRRRACGATPIRRTTRYRPRWSAGLRVEPSSPVARRTAPAGRCAAFDEGSWRDRSARPRRGGRRSQPRGRHRRRPADRPKHLAAKRWRRSASATRARTVRRFGGDRRDHLLHQHVQTRR